jgi:N,N'-diacetyllegionaminate synthase
MQVSIAGRPVGIGHPCYVIAEAGANHDSDPAKARDLVYAAAFAGADAIKFQTYTASKLSTKTAPLYWNGHETSQWECFDKLDKLPLDVLAQLIQKAPIPVFSTPFDLEAVDELHQMGVACFKLASADITYHALLRRIAQKGRPILISTGAATSLEVGEALRVCYDEGNRAVVLLQCTLKYPCPAEHINLRMMHDLRKFNTAVGLSDHSIGFAVPFAAAAMGAHALEKHYTLRKTDEGSPDHKMSVDPVELAQMVKGIREVEAALGHTRKEPVGVEAEALMYARRSVTTTKAVPAGTTFTADMITCKRPGTGVNASKLMSIVGQVARRDLAADTTVSWGDIL